MIDLFSIPPVPKPAAAPLHSLAGTGIPLRWYQREDADAMMHAIETGHKRPCCVGATGSGKGATIAEMAGRLKKHGKVICLVDRAHLVGQLANEIDRHLDTTCGRIADGECAGIQLPIVVSTIQAMYTPDRSGKPLYEYPHFKDTRTVIADEAHKVFSDSFRGVLNHFIDRHSAVAPLFTATPVAANGARWESFVDWTPAAEGPCMRTVGWCVRNGYLAKPRQAFVHVDLDLSSIYGKLSNGGEELADNEDEGDELSGLLVNLLEDKGERAAATFATGVADVIGDRKAIIFSPARITAAKLLASWLNATGRLKCEPVWGARVDKQDVLDRFKRGFPQALSNVNLLCEGYDSPAVSAVFICRLLKQWRLAQQMVGRALRPAQSCVAELNQYDLPEQAEDRQSVIEYSEKPDAVIADLVGLDGKILQASAVDVLYGDESEDVRAQIAEINHRTQFTPRPDDEWKTDDAVLQEARQQLQVRQQEQLAEMARKRGMAGAIAADVTVTFDGHSDSLPSVPIPKMGATLGEQAMFVAVATQYDLEKAKGIAKHMPRHKLKGMTFAMRRKLEAAGSQPDWQRAKRAYPEWAAAPRKKQKAVPFF